MTKKTKAKIERLAIDTENECPDIHTESYEAGATPFAEWCERFEAAIKMLEEDCFDSMQCRDNAKEVVKEYRQWLGE